MQVEEIAIKDLSDDELTKTIHLAKTKNAFHIATAVNGSNYQLITTQCELVCTTLMTVIVAAINNNQALMDAAKKSIANVTQYIYKIADRIVAIQTNQTLN